MQPSPSLGAPVLSESASPALLPCGMHAVPVLGGFGGVVVCVVVGGGAACVVVGAGAGVVVTGAGAAVVVVALAVT